MIKIAFSNLLNRRGRYIWLLVELIVVTVICWAVIDPLAVLTSQYAEPVGYDRDRLCLIDISQVDEQHREYIPGRRNVYLMGDDFMRLLARVRELPPVEYATPVNSTRLMDMEFSQIIMGEDGVNEYRVTYTSGQDFFRTFGIKAVGGDKATDYLSDLTVSGSMVVMTRSNAERKYPGRNPMASSDSLIDAIQVEHPGIPLDELPDRVVGIVEDVKPRSTHSGAYWVGFQPKSGYSLRDNGIVVRVRDGESVNSFMRNLRDIASTLKEGNFRITGVRSYADLSTQFQNIESGPQRRLNAIFAVFFLLNVSLGVVGTFWMMTRRRSGEVGVLRAFGSDRARVMKLLSMEAMLLAVTGWFIGCVIYFFYVRQTGLFLGNIENAGLTESWVESFPMHFAIVSGVILLLIAVAVFIGVAGPGLKLSRVNPVDALRSE